MWQRQARTNKDRWQNDACWWILLLLLLLSYATMHTLVCCVESSRVVGLQVSAQSSTSLEVTWRPPAQSNGHVELYLMRYRFIHNGGCPPALDSPAPGRWSRLVDIDANRLRTVLTDLHLYSRYHLKIWARTQAGRGQVAVAYATTAAAGEQ